MSTLATAALLSTAIGVLGVSGAGIPVRPPPPASGPSSVAHPAAGSTGDVGPGVPEAGPGLPRSGPGATAPRTGYGWPLHPRPQVMRGFEAPPQRWAAGHRGADLAGTAGQDVLAAGGGVVTHSGVLAGRGTVTVRHAGGRRTTYEPVDDRVPTGTRVARGQRIGRLGAGGHCPPRACLHWGLLVGPRDYRDPLMLVDAGPIVLLPL